VPSDPGPDYVSDEPLFVSLQFTVLEVLNALLGCIATLSALQQVTGVLGFPDGCYLSFVTLFFKSGKRNDVSNYRGIAILSTVCKLFELLVYRYMYEDLKGQLPDCQHGFINTEKNKHVEGLLHQYFEGLVKDIQIVVSVFSDNRRINV
jgi:hypothetical protein